MPFEMFELQEQDEGGTYHNAYIDYMQSNSLDSGEEFYAAKAAKKKNKKSTSNLDEFIGDKNEYGESISTGDDT